MTDRPTPPSEPDPLLEEILAIAASLGLWTLMLLALAALGVTVRLWWAPDFPV